MNVWEIYEFVNYRSNKDQSGRTYTPEQFNLGLKAIDIEFLKLKYGLPEEYTPGAPLPRQAWEVAQKITDDLRALKVIMGGRTKPLLSVDQYGYADIPSDYVHQSSLRYDTTVNSADCDAENEENSVPIEVLTDADFDARLNSEIKKPWSKYPFCRFNNDHIEFRPKNALFVVFSYIRMPRAAFMATTLDGNNDYIYDAANSLQLEWPTDMHTDIANLLYKWLQGNLQSPFGVQLANQRQQEGIG